ncbi:PQQ-binding-like beta-propeller repeat protein [Actinoplanes sp. NEAU-A12]|uniref:PQQ-binding-like beta-propeller repeat protein n=1 Tax=Actinoplanes sandaracinus TaxID=3045177 RepID=A0ABT6WU42_9ACTN|nr:PQQ-binding-like beta-propeller repeat protein [Actinoplanes sandaracinus]MDI6103268.1 PQQ-binding-like beta-propeller repeat protein [Actinoplanes sandaracinus]
MRDALIDLGEVPADGPEEPSLPTAPVPYRWILGLLAVILLAVLGGAGPPPPPPPAPVVLPLALGESVHVVGDRLYVIGLSDPFGTVARTHTIRSYDLPGMNLLGTYTVPVTGDIFTVNDGGDGTLVVSYNDYEFGTPGTVAVRAGGGQPVWKRAVTVYGRSPDGGLLLASEEPEVRTEESRSVWHALDPRTGAVRWSVEQPENGQLAVESGYFWEGYPQFLYTLHGDGRLEARDGLTGAITATGRHRQPVGPGTSFQVAAGLLLIGRDTGEIVAYDERTLTERWRRDDPVLPEEGYQLDCGPVICAVAMQDGLVGIDPATGREIWRADPYDTSEVIGDRVLVSHSQEAEPVLDVLDPGTGRIVARIGAWVSGGPGPAPGTAYVHRIRRSDGSVRYGVLDLGTGRVRVTGAADRIAGDCQFGKGVLLCRRLDSSLAVWRL